MSVKQLEILDMIAKGGMAEVYRARTTGPQGFEKEVCVKKILPHLTEDDSFVTMFLDEAKLAAGLNSANIVQVHDLCISGQSEYFIVMEYVDGKDLADIIRAAQLAGRQVPAPLAVHIVREVCQGLSYAHSRTDRSGAPLNIIHRDMSPHNVMVSFLGEVKILDFGIAKASSSMNQTAVGLLKGKYGYMSPEQARGRPLDPRSDIFNTGIVLYELLVGERCFAGSSDFSTLNLMRDATVTPPRAIQPGVPEGLERILLQTLSKDREKRPQTALELERILGEWASSEGQVATKSDLSRFVQELCRDEPKLTEPAGNGGFLEVKSVVAEMPLPPPPAGPKPGTAVDPSLARQPVQDGGSSAPEAEKRPSDGPETASGRSKSPAPAKGKKSVEEPDPVLPKNDAPDEAPTAKPDPAAA
ncbi:MAG: protein kinase, partial [Myxococcota bacterium]